MSSYLTKIFGKQIFFRWIFCWSLILYSGISYSNSIVEDETSAFKTSKKERLNVIDSIDLPVLLTPTVVTYFDKNVELNEFVHFCYTTAFKSINHVNSRSEYHWLHYKIKLKKAHETGVLNIPDFQINRIEVYIQSPEKQLTRIIQFGDELSVDSFNMNTRTCQGSYFFKDSGEYHIYVKYYRAGVDPTLYLQLSRIDKFIGFWNEREWQYGLAFGFLATYLLYVIWVLINQPTIYFGYFLTWVSMNFVYYFISGGHFKFYFISGSENWYSSIRQASVIAALFGITQFALTHYKQRDNLKWVTRLSVFLVSLTFLIIFSAWFTEVPIYTGYEKYFIGAIRLVIVGFVVLQFILPFNHYKKHKEFTFLSVVLIVAVVNLLGYIFLSNVPHRANFDNFNLFSVFILVFEVIVVAWGALKYSVAQEKKKNDLILEQIELQKEINQRQNDVQEKERMRIAMELHDDVLNRMSILLLLARDNYIDKNEVTKNLNEIGRDVKHYILGLYPYWTKESELNDVILNNLNEIADRLKIKLSITWDIKNASFSKLQRLQLFRLAQEFIQNSGKHGQAKHVSIKIFEDNQGLYLEFEDDGIGFDKQEVKQGLGTQGAKQRVQILGGEMEIISQKGIGVRWVITIPKFASLQTSTPMF